MELKVIETGFFKLDGGAMFGVVPKSLWSKTNPADENNLCTWAMRCLLVVDGPRAVLIDNGIGDKQDAKFFSHYYLHGEDNLVQSLAQAGFQPADITDNFLTHLHFDHCGGGTVLDGAGRIVPFFPEARYWSHAAHWDWAIYPNGREKASFLKDNLLPMQESGQLQFLQESEGTFMPGMEYFTVDGHTEKQMIPKISYKGHTIVFAADLLPSVGHIPLPYVMGYDTRPLLTLKEKEAFLREAAENKYVIFLEHDPNYSCCTVKMTEKGVRLDRTFHFHEL